MDWDDSEEGVLRNGIGVEELKTEYCCCHSNKSEPENCIKRESLLHGTRDREHEFYGKDENPDICYNMED